MITVLITVCQCPIEVPAYNRTAPNGPDETVPSRSAAHSPRVCTRFGANPGAAQRAPAARTLAVASARGAPPRRLRPLLQARGNRLQPERREDEALRGLRRS